MASLIPGYEYDIFISYRQKDNKGDRWVSEFVKALKTELESTFKEEVSVYFDINPHDGLLETHDVDDSLKEKLKCLVFIPIMSRTYCDPRSFAWEHEFKTFVEQASFDRFGLKIKLPNGNVASRVLPVRIHELDVPDVKLYESVLGGVIRGVDFVYREPGVNRPLTPEDDEEKNLNRTRFKNQINKTANAIREVISGLLSEPDSTDKDIVPSLESWDRVTGDYKRRELIASKIFSIKSIKRLIILLLIVLGSAGAFGIYKVINPSMTSKTFAIIPLAYPGNDTVLKNNGDLFTEAIHSKLREIKITTVRSRISSLAYRDTKKSLKTIRKELKVNYLLTGNIKRSGNNIILWIELISAKADKQLWSKEYLWDKDRISQTVYEIIRNTAINSGMKLTSEEIKQLEYEPTGNSDANLNFRYGNVRSYDAWSSFTMGNEFMSTTSFSSAILAYDKAIKDDSLFALAYAKRAIARSLGYYTGELDSTQIEKCRKDAEKALTINRDLPDAQTALGFYYYYCSNEFNYALDHFRMASEKAPDDYQPLFYMAIVYRKMGEWGKSQELIRRIIKYNPQEALYVTNIGLSYSFLHQFDSALIFHQKAIDIMPEWMIPYSHKIQALILKNGNTDEARNVVDTAETKTGNELMEIKILIDIYDRKYADALLKAEKLLFSEIMFKGSKYLYLAEINKYLNNPDRARIYFDSTLVSCGQDFVKAYSNPFLHINMAFAYAGLGNREQAITEAEKALDLSGNDNMHKSDLIISLAKIYTQVGAYDKAISTIEYLLMNPSYFSVKLLHLDPVWEPLAILPAFQNLISKYSIN
jgi:tetratricopeptide (TPR) repeat protein